MNTAASSPIQLQCYRSLDHQHFKETTLHPYSFVLMLSGKMEISLPHHMIILRHAQACLLATPEETVIRLRTGEYEFWLCSFDAASICKVLQHYPLLFLKFIAATCHFTITLYSRDFLQLLQALRQLQTIYQAPDIDPTILMKLLLDFIRALEELFLGYALDTSFRHLKKYYLTYCFMQLAAQHLFTQHQASFYAVQLHISTSHLRKVVQKTIRCTPKSYITHELLQTAKKAMITQPNFSHIALRLGFQSLSQFSHFFKTHTGMSPTQYYRSYIASR
ncbi:helix-turn-helix transcriptional regulator [Zhouia sp. PK063]|uniref:helix-turn-helix transcriptional regulator n=1 Tax=Zhouia sp. PK063 TaxID=3373602 RepID=UPI00379D04BC